jgi:hypothetical protein
MCQSILQDRDCFHVREGEFIFPTDTFKSCAILWLIDRELGMAKERDLDPIHNNELPNFTILKESQVKLAWMKFWRGTGECNRPRFSHLCAPDHTPDAR